VQSIFHFAGRRAMDIEGLGERLIEDLVALGYVKSPADLYALSVDDFVEMRRRADERDGTTPETVKDGKIATKWAEKLIEAIDRSRRTSLARFLFALGIEHIGEATAKSLAQWFGDLDLIRHLPWPLFKRVPDVGSEVARSLGHFFDQAGNQGVIDALLARGVLDDYLPAHAARGELLRRLGRGAEAASAFRQALALARQHPARLHLEARLAENEGKKAGEIS